MVETLALFMSKYEEEFSPFLGVCLDHVWSLLTATSLAPHYDLLVTTSIRFLTTVAASVHHAHFAKVCAGRVERGLLRAGGGKNEG